MLLELTVENYAVVEHARLRFGAGFTVLTGETGSGKSIVVDSLALLLGARASSDAVRTGQARARVSGIFTLPPDAEVFQLLEEAGMAPEPGDDLIVEREISSTGKSRAYVANRPVTTAFLRRLATYLGDIHGQNEQQNLFIADAQREQLDQYAVLGTLRNAVGENFLRWRKAQRALDEWKKTESEKLRSLDLWSFQRNEIESIAPKPGEDDQLQQERRVQGNVTRLLESSQAAYDVLYESEGSVASGIKAALKRVDELLRFDESMQPASEGLKQSLMLVQEAAFNLRDYADKLEANPARLDQIEARLEALDRLKRKYGASLDEVLAFRERVAQQADEVENAAGHREALERVVIESAAAYEEHAAQLSDRRRVAAERLSKQIATELQALAMAGTVFSIDLQPGEWTAAGRDEVKFLVSPNRGEELKPLEKVASGGELSRIALALKTAIGGVDNRTNHTLVFDEVDAGVGGAAAAAVGRRLKTLSKEYQVISVTHLPQIAGFADAHYAVSKCERAGRVGTEIVELPRKERAREIGRMLSGDRITPEALRQAEQLILAGASL